MTVLSRLFILFRDLAAWTALATMVRWSVTRRETQEAVAPGRRGPAPSLRPHTLMIDLVFAALMLLAFEIGPNTQQAAATRNLELPTLDESGATTSLLALRPVKTAGGWRYELPYGSRSLAPDEVATLARTQGRTLVLLVNKSIRVETYLDAERPLRREGLTVGLAVVSE